MDDSYLKSWNAKVTNVKDGKFVILDQTAFYPKGGGQPWDEGYIIYDHEKYRVVYVGKFSGEISHEVDKSGLKEGDEVSCELDWEQDMLICDIILLLILSQTFFTEELMLKLQVIKLKWIKQEWIFL